MTFTDDDLKRLKEEIEDSNPSWRINIESDILHALLARLEAVEKAWWYHSGECECEFCDEASKAAGK